MLQGYVIHGSDPGGPVAWLGALPPWHHVIKDTLYANQEIMGDAVAVRSRGYRLHADIQTFVSRCIELGSFGIAIGKRSHCPASSSLAEWVRLLLAHSRLYLTERTVTGYATVALYSSEKAGASIFDPRLLRWITSFYAVSFTQSFLTTSLMAYRIWQADRRSAKFRTSEGNLLPVLRILVESAALQLLVEFVLLVLYALNQNAQYILLELVTPLVVRFLLS